MRVFSLEVEAPFFVLSLAVRRHVRSEQLPRLEHEVRMRIAFNRRQFDRYVSSSEESDWDVEHHAKRITRLDRLHSMIVRRLGGIGLEVPRLAPLQEVA